MSEANSKPHMEIGNIVGQLRDTENGCEIWTGEEWRHCSNLNSQDYVNAGFDYMNPRPQQPVECLAAFEEWAIANVGPKDWAWWDTSDCEYAWKACQRASSSPMREYGALPEEDKQEVARIMTSGILKEAFAIEGVPIKALFAENLLGKAALAALLERFELRRRS